jgi:hypothetical protein
VVEVDAAPFGGEVKFLPLSAVDEVTPLSVAAITLLCEGMTALRFVGLIVFHVDLEFLRTVGKLTLPAVGTVPLLHKILAQRTLGLGTPSTV